MKSNSARPAKAGLLSVDLFPLPQLRFRIIRIQTVRATAREFRLCFATATKPVNTLHSEGAGWVEGAGLALNFDVDSHGDLPPEEQGWHHSTTISNFSIVTVKAWYSIIKL